MIEVFKLLTIGTTLSAVSAVYAAVDTAPAPSQTSSVQVEETVPAVDATPEPSQVSSVQSAEIIPAIVNEQETVTMTSEDVEEINEASVPIQDSAEMVTDAINSWLNVRSITPGELRKGGKIYYTANQVVSVGPESPQWAKARQIAFEKALMGVRGKFIFDTFGRTINNSELSSKRDDSTNNREFESDKSGISKVNAMWNKLIAGTDAKMNSWLVEQGLNPEDFAAVPSTERKDLFVEKYISKTISKAMGSASGLMPVQTFEGSDGSGNTSVGVIALYSPKLKQLASDIAAQRAPILESKRGKPLSTYVDIPEADLAGQFGVRVVFNEQGEPVVLSYGQWGYSYQGNNPRTLMRHRQTAQDTAQSKANEGLVNFINSQVSLLKETETGEVVEDFMEKTGDQITEQDMANLIDKTMKLLKSKASAKMDGTRTLRDWKHKDENGQEIVGSVRAWSYASVQAAREVRNFKSKSVKASVKEAPEQKTYNTSVRSGVTTIDYEEDF